jgi:NADH-quinone oxidoreductase subunit E
MLNPESLKKIDREIAKYPADQKQSAVMSALIIAQDEKGWLSSETMDFVARYLGMPPVAVYERKKLGIDFNETTPDGHFTLKEGECMGACAMAPVVLVNNKKMHDYMTHEKLDELIDDLGRK